MEMTGKEKCTQLRQLRRQIARDNYIDFPETACDYEGDDCAGTCELCDAELQYLERKLKEREKEGLPVFLDIHNGEALRFRSVEERKPRFIPLRDTGTRGMMRGPGGRF